MSGLAAQRLPQHPASMSSALYKLNRPRLSALRQPGRPPQKKMGVERDDFNAPAATVRGPSPRLWLLKEEVKCGVCEEVGDGGAPLVAGRVLSRATQSPAQVQGPETTHTHTRRPPCQTPQPEHWQFPVGPRRHPPSSVRRPPPPPGWLPLLWPGPTAAPHPPTPNTPDTLRCGSPHSPHSPTRG